MKHHKIHEQLKKMRKIAKNSEKCVDYHANEEKWLKEMRKIIKNW